MYRASQLATLGGYNLTALLTPASLAGRPSDDNTIFVKGFDSSLGEDGVRAALTETFSKYGKVNQVRLPSDRETGDLKGIGFIEFESQDAKASSQPML